MFPCLMIVSIICFAFCANISASGMGPDVWLTSPEIVTPMAFADMETRGDQFEGFVTETGDTIIPTPTDGGIREEIPQKYKERFDKWKTELLSTEVGRQQWDRYANNKQFILTIVVSNDLRKGAGTGNFLWDDKGSFVGATITLGPDLERGFPDPIYYPVLNSLSTNDAEFSINGRIVAAAKLIHEIDHVNQSAAVNLKVLQLQTRLMPVWSSIFLKNGLNAKDKRLTDLEKQMGGTPTEIWASREYWSEVNAMLFLKERISKEEYYCFVFNKIRRNLDSFAGNYGQRFIERSEFADSPCWK